LLRDELGFDGLVVGDALGMAASGEDNQGRALVRFLVAGGDLGIIGPGGSVQGRKAVIAALRSGELDQDRVDDAALRVFAAKGIDPCSVRAGKPPSRDAGTTPSDPPVVNPTTQ
jgi:beta-N-acetylhexosaminidase